MPHGIAIQAAPTFNGTQNYTKTGMGTPLGALMFMSQVTALNTDVSDFAMSIGATELAGENGAMGYGGTEDNQAISDSRGIQQSDELLRLATPGTDSATEQANNNDAVTDGIQLDWVTTNTAHQVAALMFNEGVANFDMRYQALNGTGDTVVNVGFQPDLVLWLGGNFRNEFGTNDANIGFDAYHRANDIYASAGVYHVNNETAPLSAEHFSTDRMITTINLFNGNRYNDFTLGSFTGTGFTATKMSSTDTMEVIQVCIKMDTGYDCAVGNFAAPTATGIQEVAASLGFTPQMAMFYGVDQVVAGGNNDSSTFHIGAAIEEGDQFSVGGYSQAFTSVANSNTGSHMRDDACLYQTDDSGTLQSKAALSTFGTGSIDLNFSVASRAIQVGYVTMGYVGVPTIISVPTGPLR